MSYGSRWVRRVSVGALSVLAAGGVGLAGAPAGAAAPAAPAGTLTAGGGPYIGNSPIAVTQLGGANRFATAALIAERAFPAGASTAVVVSGASADLADALAASFVAAEQDHGTGAPILLVDPTGVPPETAAALSSLKVTHIVIVGGPGSVAASVATGLTTATVSVSRIAGSNRLTTADAADSQAGVPPTGAGGTGATGVPAKGSTTALVADGAGADLVDALGAAPLADAGPFPVFLVNGAGGSLSGTDLSIIKSDGITAAILVGGSAALGPQVGTQLKAAGVTPTQVAGPNRSATSVALADFAIKTLGFSSTHFNIASGDQAHLVDSLAGGPLGGAQRAPTLVTSSVEDPGSVLNFVSGHFSTETTTDLFGGFGSVTPTAVAAIASPSGTAAPVTGIATAEAEATTLLASETVPPGSVPVAGPPTANPPTIFLNLPAEAAACLPLVDDATFWVVPGTTGPAVSSYLQSHLTPGTTLGAVGQSGTTSGAVSSAFVAERTTAGQSETLVFTFVALGNGSVGLRVDAQVIPSGAMCASGGGGSGAANGPSVPAGG